MKFKELAWGAFVFSRMTRKDEPYQGMVTDSNFLTRLQIEPSLDDFQRLRDFLTHYGVPWAPRNLANQYTSIWPKLKFNISKLVSIELNTCDFKREEIRNAIMSAYGYLQSPHVWGSDTVASKILHFFNISLFVMWDIDIQSAYGKLFGPQGYLEYLTDIQYHSKEVISDFEQLAFPGELAEFLSQQLGYRGIRPLTKFIDDYNWTTITQRWPKHPPDWILNLYDSD